jgi:subtilisin family serine protease
MKRYAAALRNPAARFAISLMLLAPGLLRPTFALAAPGGSSQAPTPAVRGIGDVIPDQYIVVFKPDTPDAANLSDRLARDTGGTVLNKYERAVKGFAGRISQQRIDQLRANPNVLLVEQDRRVGIAGVESDAPWGLDRVDQRNLPLNGTYHYISEEAPVNVYVLDTGILPTHADFGGRASVAFDNVGDGQNGIDCNGHGTHVAGTIGGSNYGVAKFVTLHAVRVLGCNGSATTAGVIAGVDWVTANAVKPAVANMSLGGGFSAALNQAVTNSINSGITYTIAAGNDGLNACDYSPGSTPEAITVGATDQTDQRASFSDVGTCVDLFAPGVAITSDWIGSDTATRTISGTSTSAPLVAGVAALYLTASPSSTPAQVASAIVQIATKNTVGNPGVGSPNMLAFSRITDQ